MTKFYVIVPVVLLALFSFVYMGHMKESKQKEIDKQAAIQKQHDEEAEKKRIAEQKAREDADKRTAQRVKEENEKEAAKQAKYQSDIDAIKKDTNKYQSEADNYSKQAASLDTELTNLRANKEKLIREAFELDKKVEMGKVERRNAEFELQRYTDMIAKRASESAMAKIPPVVATNAPGK